MKYNFYIPKKLSGISNIIWEQKTTQHHKWRFLPEFNIDLIFNLGEPWNVHSDFYKERSFNPTAHFCFLSGLHIRPLYVEFTHCHMFGIQLNTLAASMIFDVPCSELRNWAIEGDVIFQQKLNYIQDHIQALPDFHARAVWLENFVYSLVSPDSDSALVFKISSVLDKLYTGKHDNIKAPRIEDLTGYSRMHTSRLFYKWFGTSPSEAVAFKRFVSALDQIHAADSSSLSQIALDSGYYDQPHFTRVFKQFAEMTPREYLRQKTDMRGQLPY